MPTWILDSDGPPEPSVLAHTEKETISTDAWSAAVQLKCLWDDRHATMISILSNKLPWPYNPSLGLIAKTGQIDTFSSELVKSIVDNTLNDYKHAILTINFEKKKEDEEDEDGDLYTETLEDNGQLMKLPPKNVQDTVDDWYFRWGPAATDAEVTPEEAPTILQLGMDYVVKWKNLATVPAGVLSFKNKVNHEDVVSPSLGITFPAETLLGASAVISRTINSNFEASGWDVELRWSQRDEGWNKFWNPKTVSYQHMYLHTVPFNDTNPGVIYKNYPPTDMSGLLP